MPVVAFEADMSNYEKCKNRLKSYSNVEVYNIGLSDIQETLYFKGGGGSGSSILSVGNELVRTDTIDNICAGMPISFIKMDIEGFEVRALRGAAESIKKYKPVLAISIYHKRDDIYTIPSIILSLNENYRFYFRHYSLGRFETVLYAINTQ